MTPERWRQLTEIFGGAVAIGDTVGREAYLVAACGSDASLRAEIDSLIDAHSKSGSLAGGAFLRDVQVSNRLEIGMMLGPYRVEALLGVGGMGEVYRARDTRLGRTVALKTLPTHLLANPQLLSRFESEARAIALLNHPNICTLHDIGRHENIDFLVMELVDGETLSARLHRGPLPIAEAIAVAHQIAEALSTAHAKGVIHRDIKPSNIILTRNGRVKVLDFGLAREAPSDTSTGAARGDETDHGLRMGTLHYMSAEQSLGRDLDTRTDLFSLGVVLFECLTGQLPFEGETRAEYLHDLAHGTPKSVASLRPEVSHELQTIVARCLERNLSKRFDSAALLAAELEAIARPQRFNRWTLAAVGLAGVVAAAVFLVQGWTATPTDPPVRHRRFTTFAGEELGSRLSPSGSWMSYIRTERGERQLVVQGIQSGEPTRVALPGGVLQSQVWSPDENGHAALMSTDTTWMVHIVRGMFGDGAPPRSVTLPEIPSSARLLRWIDRSIYIFVYESRRSVSLRRLDVDSLRLEIVKGPWTAMNVTSLDVRPDGLEVAWIATAARTQRDEIWTAGLNGGGPKLLTALDDKSRKHFVLWNGLGNKLIYQSNLSGQPDLWELDVRTRRSTPLTTDGGLERPDSSSADGSLSYQLRTDKATLYAWKDGKGAGVPLISEGLSNFAPSVSSQGRLRLAYQRSQPSPGERFMLTDSEIYVSDVSESGMTLEKSTRIATGLAPRISPDGRHVAYLQLLRTNKTEARLMVTEVDSGRSWQVSSALSLPANFSFPVSWSEQTVAWLSARDLCFVERAADGVASRLVRFRVGEGITPIAETETTARITDIYPSSNGTQIAYLARAGRTAAHQREYALHVADLSMDTHQVLKHLGTSATIRLRGWLANDSGLLLDRELSDGPARRYDLFSVSRGGVVEQLGGIDRVSSISALVPHRSELYFTGLTAGIGDLFAYSLTRRNVRRVTDNSASDVTFGDAGPLGPDYVVGIRHEQTSDIYLFDAGSGAGRGAGRR